MSTKKQATISDELRKEICIYAQKHINSKQQSIADFFNNKYPSLGTGHSTIAKILKESSKWLSIDTNSISRSKFQNKNPKFPLLDEALNRWVEQVSASAVVLNEQLIKEKGWSFANLLGIDEDDFHFSNGWIQKFKKRNQLVSYKFHGEGASAPIESLPEEQRKLQEVISRFECRF